MARAEKFALCVALLLVPTAVRAQMPAATLQIEPQKVLVDLLYGGAEIRISGKAPVSEGLAVLCTGDESTVELKQKGKVWGLFWLNVGDATFTHMPALYQLSSTKALRALASDADLVRAGMGFSALEAKSIPGSSEEQHRLFMELMKLKEHEGLYSIQEGKVKVDAPVGPMQNFSTVLHLPSSVGSGKYPIRLIGFDKGRSTLLASGMISIQLSGSAALIKTISLKHGLLYGIFAVVIALAAGLSTGLIFGRRTLKGTH
jgi:uncharacterized protein (TIGR02186 family)